MQVEKVYQVLVKAYHKQEVPKHTKYFDTEEKANIHKEELLSYIWNTSVSVEVIPVYSVIDGNTKYILNGSYVTVTH
jgi:hypothetical protein